jgi:hypothetical protein
MSLYSSIVLALVGWYLLVPPLSSRNSNAVEINAPLSNWHIFQSFDSVSECEALRERIRQGEKGTPYYQAILTSACIASDDPRLKEK